MYRSSGKVDPIVNHLADGVMTVFWYWVLWHIYYDGQHLTVSKSDFNTQIYANTVHGVWITGRRSNFII